MTEIPQTDNDTLRLHVKSLEILAKARGTGGDQTVQQDIEAAVAVINALARERDDMAEGCRDAENLAHDRLADIDALSLKLAETEKERDFWKQDSERMSDVCASNSKQFDLLAADYAAVRDKLAAARLESKYLINIPAILDFERIEKELNELAEEKAMLDFLEKCPEMIDLEWEVGEDESMSITVTRWINLYARDGMEPTSLRAAIKAAMKNTNDNKI